MTWTAFAILAIFVIQYNHGSCFAPSQCTRGKLLKGSSKQLGVFKMFDTKAVFFRMADHVCPSSFLLCSSSSFDGIIRDCLCQPSRDIPVCPRSRLTLQHIVKLFCTVLHCVIDWQKSTVFTLFIVQHNTYTRSCWVFSWKSRQTLQTGLCYFLELDVLIFLLLYEQSMLETLVLAIRSRNVFKHIMNTE